MAAAQRTGVMGNISSATTSIVDRRGIDDNDHWLVQALAEAALVLSDESRTWRIDDTDILVGQSDSNGEMARMQVEEVEPDNLWMLKE